MAFRSRHIALAALLALALAGCAGTPHGRGRFGGISQATTPKADPVALMIAGLDIDLDGVVTGAELTAAIPKLWASADANGDGTISVLELNAWRRHWFGSDDGWPGQFHFDTDGDGVITRKEFEIGLRAIFDDYDANKDGKIERSELLASQHNQQGRAGSSDGNDRRGGGRHRQPGGGDDDDQ